MRAAISSIQKQLDGLGAPLSPTGSLWSALQRGTSPVRVTQGVATGKTATLLDVLLEAEIEKAKATEEATREILANLHAQEKAARTEARVRARIEAQQAAARKKKTEDK